MKQTSTYAQICSNNMSRNKRNNKNRRAENSDIWAPYSIPAPRNRVLGPLMQRLTECRMQTCILAPTTWLWKDFELEPMRVCRKVEGLQTKKKNLRELAPARAFRMHNDQYADWLWEGDIFFLLQNYASEIGHCSRIFPFFIAKALDIVLCGSKLVGIRILIAVEVVEHCSTTFWMFHGKSTRYKMRGLEIGR